MGRRLALPAGSGDGTVPGGRGFGQAGRARHRTRAEHRDDGDRPHRGGRHQTADPAARETAAPHRELDQEVRRRRHGQGDRHAQAEELAAPETRPGGIDPQEYREVPEIDAVADSPQPEQRPPRQVAPEDRAGDDEDRQHDRGRPERGDQETSFVEEVLGALQVCPQDGIEGESRHSDQEKDQALAHVEAREDPALSAPGERGGQGCTEQDRLRARIGPVVEAGFAGAVVEEHRHLGGRRQRAHQREPEHGADLSEDRQHAHDEQGPDEIELLLDGQ